MKEKAAAREAALKLTIESAGGKLELFNWTVPGSDYNGVTITEFPDAGTYTAVVSLVEATGAFSEIKAIELLTAREIDRGLGKSLTYRAWRVPGPLVHCDASAPRTAISSITSSSRASSLVPSWAQVILSA